MINVAAAPSVRKLEFAAVCVPAPFLTKAGFSLASCSGVEEALMPFSDVSAPVAPWTSSSAYRPASCAACARVCDMSVYSSCASRETPNFAARRSDEWPMTSLVVKFLMAGASGAKSPGFKPFSKPNAPAGPFFMAFAAPRRRFRTGREKRMGTSENVSQPPAMTTSACPARIFSAPWQMAALAETHASVTVCAGTLVGRPACIAASRAMLDVRGSWITVPRSR
mmetsp:Transcript_22166/g.68344  ORF Transcript_22166/g.68344 Transcript_22166/m.68344 type:complete len:224 (+) Transcript_22166:468-1139(+)